MLVKRKLDGAVDESSANQEIYKSDITYEKSEGLHLAELVLQQAGWLAGRSTKFRQSWIILKLKIFDIPFCLAKAKHYFSNFNAFLALSSSKHCYKVVLKVWSFAKPYHFVAILTFYCYPNE